MSDDAPALDASCANCGAVLHGRFCARCGQEDKPLDPPVRRFAREFAQELFDVDSRVLRSLRKLVFAPGFLTREHVEGRRVPWLSPLKLYLLTSVAAFAVMALAGGDSGLRIAFTAKEGDTVVERPFGFDSNEALTAAINEARVVWIPRVLFVLVPFFGGLVAIARRSAGRRYPSHLVFALHVHAAAFAVRAVASALSVVTPAGVDQALNSVLVLYVVAYFPMALRRAYGGSRLKAAVDTVAVGFVYWMVALLVAGGVVIGAALVPRWMASWGF
jgi:hypothetical protein